MEYGPLPAHCVLSEGLSKGTAQRAIHSLPKNRLQAVSAMGSGQSCLMAGERVTHRTF
jgi:hypothetical protein